MQRLALRGLARAAAPSAAVSGVQRAVRETSRHFAMLADSLTGLAAIAAQEPLLNAVMTLSGAVLAVRLPRTALLVVMRGTVAVRGAMSSHVHAIDKLCS